MTKSYNLTDTQANLVKDILKVLGNDDELNEQVANAVGLTLEDFNDQADLIFVKLGNGRVTVES